MFTWLSNLWRLVLTIILGIASTTPPAPPSSSPGGIPTSSSEALRLSEAGTSASIGVPVREKQREGNEDGEVNSDSTRSLPQHHQSTATPDPETTSLEEAARKLIEDDSIPLVRTKALLHSYRRTFSGSSNSPVVKKSVTKKNEQQMLPLPRICVQDWSSVDISGLFETRVTTIVAPVVTSTVCSDASSSCTRLEMVGVDEEKERDDQEEGVVVVPAVVTERITESHRDDATVVAVPPVITPSQPAEQDKPRLIDGVRYSHLLEQLPPSKPSSDLPTGESSDTIIAVDAFVNDSESVEESIASTSTKSVDKVDIASNEAEEEAPTPPSLSTINFADILYPASTTFVTPLNDFINQPTIPFYEQSSLQHFWDAPSTFTLPSSVALPSHKPEKELVHGRGKENRAPSLVCVWPETPEIPSTALNRLSLIAPVPYTEVFNFAWYESDGAVVHSESSDSDLSSSSSLSEGEEECADDGESDRASVTTTIAGKILKGKPANGSNQFTFGILPRTPAPAPSVLPLTLTKSSRLTFTPTPPVGKPLPRDHYRGAAFSVSPGVVGVGAKRWTGDGGV